MQTARKIGSFRATARSVCFSVRELVVATVSSVSKASFKVIGPLLVEGGQDADGIDDPAGEFADEGVVVRVVVGQDRPAWRAAPPASFRSPPR